MADRRLGSRRLGGNRRLGVSSKPFRLGRPFRLGNCRLGVLASRSGFFVSVSQLDTSDMKRLYVYEDSSSERQRLLSFTVAINVKTVFGCWSLLAAVGD